eukprot:SAG31_NODE_11636_length_1011_cov_1.077851_1_plen_172_part_00
MCEHVRGRDALDHRTEDRTRIPPHTLGCRGDTVDLMVCTRSQFAFVFVFFKKTSVHVLNLVMYRLRASDILNLVLARPSLRARSTYPSGYRYGGIQISEGPIERTKFSTFRILYFIIKLCTITGYGSRYLNLGTALYDRQSGLRYVLKNAEAQTLLNQAERRLRSQAPTYF